ncbi:trichohyalin isoform X2 [Nasonia vitripennis]|nr:trichohyalin isoform X2 [Nasonia vitripennis]
MRIVEVYKEIQEQEINILKAFYVDLLVPLETNLEKDTKVVQSEQKKFLQQHKTRSETYSKAAATMKKQRKKSRGASKSGLAMDKELKNMQILEEEKSKLDAFCEQSLKNAMTQERRRYGFVLERQCSLAKHYASFHEVALAALHPSVDEWREIAATREYLPQSVEDMFASRLRQVSFWPEDEENGGSELTMSSQLRKTRSMDSSCLELRLGPPPQSQSTSAGLGHGGHGQGHTSGHMSAALSRARSEANLHASTLSLGPEVPDTPPRPRSMAPISRNSGGIGGGLIAGGWGEASLARALFAYLSSGENQLSFHEGDLIALMGDRQKGWQFGENLRTQCSGWFPLAYTEVIIDEALGSPNHSTSNGRGAALDSKSSLPPCKPPPSRPPMPSNGSDGETAQTNGNDATSNGHILNGSASNSSGSNNNGPGSNVPKSNSSHNIAAPTGRQSKAIRPTGTLPTMLSGGGGRRVQPPVPPVPPPQVVVTSLHSSNDSGFSNEPPVQPDIDYSDDEAMRLRRRKAADRPIKQQKHQHKQQQQQQSSKKDEGKLVSSSESKDWENDSWKTLPRDDKSWHIYRSSMTEYWSDATSVKNEKPGRHESEERRNARNVEQDSSNSPTKKERKQQQQREQNDSQKNEYENTRAIARSSKPERNGNFSSNEDHGTSNIYSRRSEREEERSRHERREIETEDDEIEVEVDVEDEEEEESYNVTMEYRSEKYENKKYYENQHQQHRNEDNHRSDYRRNGGDDDESKYNNDKSSESESSQSSESEDETIPETGRKVEQIAQKLEQTAQKYAREHSPPKFIERRSVEYNSKTSLDRPLNSNNDDSKAGYEKYEREQMRVNSSRTVQQQQQPQQQRSSNGSGDRDRDRYNDKSLASSRQSTLTYERERSYEKKRNAERSSSRGFERPRPPSQEAPERPTDQQQQQQQQKEQLRYRERRYSEKEDIYGETTTIGFANDSLLVEKDRGYESNFETKLERTKVLERHGYTRSTSERNDTNNNSLKTERKPLMPRQSTAMGHLIQTGRGLDIENKSPKLVKRTKSFWRFRRDSEVLEGMALWQHRSLVDIPKMLKKDEHRAKDERTKSRDESRKSNNSSEGSPDPSHRSLERKNSGSTITNERINGIEHLIQDEPKPAERMHLPEKSTSSLDYFEDLPTPAERPKMSERSEYRRHHEEPQQQQQRGYFVGNVSRKAILENERKRSIEAKRNLIVAELKETNQVKRNNERRKKAYGDDDDGLMIQHFTETEASDEESTYSCIIVKDQAVSEKTLLPRTKLRRDSERGDRNKKTCGPWYDLWGVDQSVIKKKKKKQQ